MNVYSNAVRHLPEVMSSEKFERVAGQAARTFYDCEVTNALRARLEALVKRFHETVGEDRVIDFIARAPGRINLIGEHIDYCGGSVLPMAVSQDVLIAVSRNPNPQAAVLNVFNVEPKFESKSFDLTNPIVIDKSVRHWTNYFLCGNRGVLEEHETENPAMSLDCVVYGSVPPGAGMSSSSALVCAAALATATAHNLSISKKDLADLAQRSERRVGTESGGMDQAISMLGEAGFAKRIDFNPLQATSVKLPGGATWVVANCLVESHKVVTAAVQFNKRVVECRIASVLLAKLMGVENWKSAFPLLRFSDLSREELLQKASELLPEDPATAESIELALGCPPLDVMPDIANAPNVFKANIDFHIKKRALHVLSEASRVYEFQAVCERGGDVNAQLQALGALMCASHESCDQLYDCSSPELNALQKVSMANGALGSRLTGAGWGGCTISLVPTEKLDSYLALVSEGYYASLPNLPAERDSYLFATHPAHGARVLDLAPKNRLSDSVWCSLL